MKWRIQNNGSLVVDENENIVCTFSDNTEPLHKALIKYAPMIFDEIMNYS